MIYVIIGAPGAGKGIRAEIIEEKIGIPHISTGNMIRDNKEIYEKYKEKIENGQLLSDEIISELLEDRLSKEDAKQGCIIDGYPRTIEQAHRLDEILTKLGKKIDKVFLIDADTETIYSRILNRMVCTKCGEIYNKKYAAENDNKCSKCGHELSLRAYDNSITLKNRIDRYYSNINEIKEYYEKKEILEVIDALEESSKIVERI